MSKLGYLIKHISLSHTKNYFSVGDQVVVTRTGVRENKGKVVTLKRFIGVLRCWEGTRRWEIGENLIDCNGELCSTIDETQIEKVVVTVQDQIKVMQMFAEGEQIEYRTLGAPEWAQALKPLWDFSSTEYRVERSKFEDIKSVGELAQRLIGGQEFETPGGTQIFYDEDATGGPFRADNEPLRGLWVYYGSLKRVK